MTREILRRTLVTWVMFVVVDLLGDLVLPRSYPGGGNVMAWSLAANAIVAGALSFVAARSTWREWRRALALSVVPLAIGVINVVEGMFYLKSAIARPAWLLTFFVIKYALVLPLWLLMFRPADGLARGGTILRARAAGGGVWRFFFCVFLYVILYFGAGLIIFPWVREFYSTQQLPPPAQILALQFLLRGPVFTGICVLLWSMIGGPRRRAAITVGVVFALISGVAPLILPQPFFPDQVRWIHLCEVTGANFLFGVLVALIWFKPPTGSRAVAATGGAV